jgi:lactam utilization protein B
VENATVTAVTGEELQLPLGDHEVSLCCHSDSPGAVEIVKAAREIVGIPDIRTACEIYTDFIQVDQFNSKHFPKT